MSVTERREAQIQSESLESMCLLQKLRVEFRSQRKIRGTSKHKKKKDCECLLRLTQSQNTLLLQCDIVGELDLSLVKKRV